MRTRYLSAFIGMALCATLAHGNIAVADLGERGRHREWEDHHGNRHHHKKHGWRGYYPPPSQVYIYRAPRPVWALDSYEYTPPPPRHKTCRWQRGGYVPGYVSVRPVYGWQERHLVPPPPGAFYGYVDNDLLLISQATYQILDVLVRHRR